MPATHDDAQLMVQLLRWNDENGGGEAMKTVFSPDFDAEAATTYTEGVHQILMLGETVGTFVKHGVLDREMLLDLFWMQAMWAKVGPAALKARAEAGEPRLYENFEALAQ